MEHKPLLPFDRKRINTNLPLSYSYLDDLHKRGKHNWNALLSLCSEKNDVTMMQYCINNGAGDCYTALSVACYYNADNAIKFLLQYSDEVLNKYFLFACGDNRIVTVITMLKMCDNIDLKYLKSMAVNNDDDIFNIIMVRPFTITRQHFWAFSSKYNADLYNKLNDYNNRSLVETIYVQRYSIFGPIIFMSVISFLFSYLYKLNISHILDEL